MSVERAGTPGAQGFAGGISRAWERSRHTVSMSVAAVCIAVFVLLWLLDVLGIVSRQDAVSVLGLSWTGVRDHLWLHEFVTAPLIHAGIAHLLFNMLSLWMLGPSVEARLGRVQYLVFSGVCAGASMAGFLLLSSDARQICVGYSGVIFGILVAQAVFYPNTRIALFAFFPLRMKYAVVILAGVEIYLTVTPERAGIAHAAHLGGAVAAFVYLKGFQWQAAVRERRRARRARPVRKPKARQACRDIPREL